MTKQRNFKSWLHVRNGVYQPLYQRSEHVLQRTLSVGMRNGKDDDAIALGMRNWKDDDAIAAGMRNWKDDDAIAAGMRNGKGKSSGHHSLGLVNSVGNLNCQ